MKLALIGRIAGALTLTLGLAACVDMTQDLTVTSETTAKATMTMSQPFADAKDMWLPRGLEMNIAMTMAAGQFDVRYALDYTDYRRPDVTSKVGIKER